MCDGVSEAALLGGVAATTEAASAGAVATAGLGGITAATTAAAGAELAAPVASGFLGSGISGSSLLGIGATAGSTGLSMISRMASQSQNAGLYIANAMNQNRAAAQTYNGLNLQQETISDKTATANFDVVKGMAQAKGKAIAAAGEAGVGGNSFGDVLSDLEMRAGTAEGTNDLNYQTGIQQAQSSKDAVYDNTVANISGMVVPNSTGYFAGLGADAINGGLKIADIYGKANAGPLVPTGTTS